MVEIPLSNGMTAKIDDADASRISLHHWYAYKHRSSRTYYARSAGKGAHKTRKELHMHRVILGVPPPGMVIDHIDGNGLNNCRSNLRFVPYSVNAVNQPKRFIRGRTSRFKGVSRDHKTGLWKAMIKWRGVRIYAGCFKSEEEAGRKYDELAHAYHGQYARPNEPSLYENTGKE